MTVPVGDRAWVAGIIDMKGKIVRKRNKSRVSPQVVLWVETKDMSIIRGLGKLTGTSPEMMKTPAGPAFNRRNCVEHCPSDHVHVDPNYFPATARWTISGLSLGVLLWNVKEYTRSGKPWDETMEELFSISVIAGRGSGAVIKSLRRLAALGWATPPEIQPVLGMEVADDDNEEG
jgi:hypothetical protein